MGLIRFLRKSKRGLFSYRAAIMCVAFLSFLLVRSTPPSLPHINLGLTVHSIPDHGHRMSFDHQDFQWGDSPAATRPAPPPVASAHLTTAAAPFVEIERDGWHFNRPPPIS